MKMRSMAVAVLLTFFLSCRSDKQSVPVEESQFLLDTLVRISVYDHHKTSQKTQQTIDRAFNLMREIEGRTSVHIDTSEVTRIVQKAGRDYVNVSDETLWILKQSMEVSKHTRGLFDVSIGSIKALWGFDREPFRVPDPASIQSLLSHVNYRDILFRDNAVMLRSSPMRIDLGGIAKGYIIDRAVEFLKEAGIQSGIVEAGGDLRIWGKHPHRDAWKIGIKHPRGKANGLIGVLSTQAVSIATSGDYERFFIRNGKRYHHLLDPRTGYPASGCVSVTIVTESAILADAYATAVFIMGPEQGMQFIEQSEGIEGLILFEREGRLRHIMSNGIQNQIQMF
jgi:thiamine biosynthesis lipoprotein